MKAKKTKQYLTPCVEVLEMALSHGLLSEALGSGELPDSIDLVNEDEW